MERFFVKEEELFEYLMDNIGDLTEEIHEVAVNDDTGVSIGVTFDDPYGFRMSVTVDDELVQDELLPYDNELPKECIDLYKYFIKDYLQKTPAEMFRDFLSSDEDDDDDDYYQLRFRDFDEYDEIANREQELYDATSEYLNVVSDSFLTEGQVDEITEAMLDYLANVYDIDIYRPMVIDDGEGSYIDDYPYGLHYEG